MNATVALAITVKAVTILVVVLEYWMRRRAPRRRARRLKAVHQLIVLLRGCLMIWARPKGAPQRPPAALLTA